MIYKLECKRTDLWWVHGLNKCTYWFNNTAGSVDVSRRFVWIRLLLLRAILFAKFIVSCLKWSMNRKIRREVLQKNCWNIFTLSKLSLRISHIIQVSSMRISWRAHTTNWAPYVDLMCEHWSWQEERNISGSVVLCCEDVDCRKSFHIFFGSQLIWQEVPELHQRVVTLAK